MSLRLLRLPVLATSLATCLALASLAPAARAQTTGGVTINVVQEASLPRLTSTGGTVTKRALNLEPEGVSLQDCLDDQRIAFPLQLTGQQPQATLEAWAGLSGVDCGVQTNRTSGTKVCWKIAEGIALEPTPRPAIPVRQILSGVVDPINPISDARICGKVNLTTISVQFLYFAPGQLANPATKKDLQVRADTVGPDAPGNVDLLPGNGRIRISFGGLGEGGLTQYTGIRAYCAPASRGSNTAPAVERKCTEASTSVSPGDGAVGPDGEVLDSSTIIDTPENCEDVEVEAGSSTSESCTNAALSAIDAGPDTGTSSSDGRIVPNDAFNAQYQCGSIFGNTGSALIADSLGGKPLENYKEYAVAIAAIDQFGNVGPLSNVRCETPEPTTDFWENYKNAGGGAGGGICSVDGAGLPVGSFTVMSVFGLAALGTLRRRRTAADKKKVSR